MAHMVRLYDREFPVALTKAELSALSQFVKCARAGQPFAARKRVLAALDSAVDKLNDVAEYPEAYRGSASD